MLTYLAIIGGAIGIAGVSVLWAKLMKADAFGYAWVVLLPLGVFISATAIAAGIAGWPSDLPWSTWQEHQAWYWYWDRHLFKIVAGGAFIAAVVSNVLAHDDKK